MVPDARLTPVLNLIHLLGLRGSNATSATLTPRPNLELPAMKIRKHLTRLAFCALFALLTATATFGQKGNLYYFDNFDVPNGVRVDTPAPHPTPAKKNLRLTAATRERTPVPARNLQMTAGSSLDGFTTGNSEVDNLIVASGVRNGVDPILLYAIMHRESAFKQRAISYKGARGLMQLMPATAARFGVRNIFDPRENIEAGARYMRFLLNLFHNNVPLALAGYNAGEGAVMKYGWQVPPYSETREYVRRISDRYQLMRDPQAARKAQPITQTQYAAIKAEAQKETIVAPAYERSIERVRLPNGQSMLVSQ